MHRVLAKRRIILHFFQSFGMGLEVLLSGVARRGFSLFSGFSALQGDDSDFAFFLSHDLLLFP